MEKLRDLFLRSGGVLSYEQDIEQLLRYDTDEWDLGRLLRPLAGGGRGAALRGRGLWHRQVHARRAARAHPLRG